MNTGAWFVAAIVRPDVAGVPACVPSDGVTETAMESPASPLPACERSKVSLSAEPLVKVRLTTPLTFHCQVRLTGSPSGSFLVAVAVSVSFVPALPGVSTTEALGGEFEPAIEVLPESLKLKPATG